MKNLNISKLYKIINLIQNQIDFSEEIEEEEAIFLQNIENINSLIEKLKQEYQTQNRIDLNNEKNLEILIFIRIYLMDLDSTINDLIDEVTEIIRNS